MEIPANLTLKQFNFAVAYLETLSAPEAALRAYNCSSRNSARVIAHRNLHNPKIIAFFQSVTVEHGLLSAAVRTLKDALGAKEVFVNRKTHEKVEVPDHDTRLKAAHEIFKIVDAYPRG